MLEIWQSSASPLRRNSYFLFVSYSESEAEQEIEIVYRITSIKLCSIAISRRHNCLAKCSWCEGVWQLKWHILLVMPLLRLGQSPGERK